MTRQKSYLWHANFEKLFGNNMKYHISNFLYVLVNALKNEFTKHKNSSEIPNFGKEFLSQSELKNTEKKHIFKNVELS